MRIFGGSFFCGIWSDSNLYTLGSKDKPFNHEMFDSFLTLFLLRFPGGRRVRCSGVLRSRLPRLPRPPGRLPCRYRTLPSSCRTPARPPQLACSTPPVTRPYRHVPAFCDCHWISRIYVNCQISRICLRYQVLRKYCLREVIYKIMIEGGTTKILKHFIDSSVGQNPIFGHGYFSPHPLLVDKKKHL